MLIHSVTPLEYLMPPPPMGHMECMAFGGGYVQGYRTDKGLEVSRVISTDPAVYLDPQLQPGAVLDPAALAPKTHFFNGTPG